MGEFVVHVVDPRQEGPLTTFVEERAAQEGGEPLDLDDGGMRQVVFAAEEVDVSTDATSDGKPSKVVGVMVCRWGMFGNPHVQEVVARTLNGHTKEVTDGFAKSLASLSELTGLNFSAD
jgi:hypothetical protein